jgi:hypothetical protein
MRATVLDSFRQLTHHYLLIFRKECYRTCLLVPAISEGADPDVLKRSPLIVGFDGQRTGLKIHHPIF